MKIFNKKLKRDNLSKKFYGYHQIHKVNDKEAAIKYLNEITDYLNNYSYKLNSDFELNGRKKFLYDEVISVLKKEQKEDNPIYFVLGSLEEFMCCNNFLSMEYENFVELRNKNDKYIKNGYISLEEKECIINMINIIKEGID